MTWNQLATNLCQPSATAGARAVLNYAGWNNAAGWSRSWRCKTTNLSSSLMMSSIRKTTRNLAWKSRWTKLAPFYLTPTWSIRLFEFTSVITRLGCTWRSSSRECLIQKTLWRATLLELQTKKRFRKSRKMKTRTCISRKNKLTFCFHSLPGSSTCVSKATTHVLGTKNLSSTNLPTISSSLQSSSSSKSSRWTHPW